MEEIIGLLIIVGTLILKVVGNRLEKSGKKAAPEAVPQDPLEDLSPPHLPRIP